MKQEALVLLDTEIKRVEAKLAKYSNALAYWEEWVKDRVDRPGYRRFVRKFRKLVGWCFYRLEKLNNIRNWLEEQ